MADTFCIPIPIPAFRGDDYSYWSIKMKTYFCAQKLWDIVNTGYNIPHEISSLTEAEKKVLEENQQKDALALFAIQMSLPDQYFSEIIGSTGSAKAAWDKLEQQFKKQLPPPAVSEVPGSIRSTDDAHENELRILHGLQNAITGRKWEVAEELLNVNGQNALTASLNEDGETPLHVAIKQDGAGQLAFVTKLVDMIMDMDSSDLAVDLLKYNPSLAFNEDNCVLEPLAKDPLAFPSAGETSFWEWETSLTRPWKWFYKLRKGRSSKCHGQAIELVDCICKSVQQLLRHDEKKACEILDESFLLAAENGIVEIVSRIVNSYPAIMVSATSVEKNQTAFHLAVIYRREEVWKILYDNIKGKDTSFLSELDDQRKSILHLAGYLPQQRRDRHGIILEMQRELQWFKTVKELVGPQDINIQDETLRTPMEVFNKEHVDMAKNEIEWMMGMANACSVVASLVATVAFAAAITVPGGNDNKGLPYFSEDKSFLVFATADALALFSSFGTVLAFLSIYTSSYDIYDYFQTLPNKLMFGLFFLFLSVVSLMIAFSSTLFIVFAKENMMTLLPISLFAFGTILMYAYGQIRPLHKMFRSTYGRGIFG